MTHLKLVGGGRWADDQEFRMDGWTDLRKLTNGRGAELACSSLVCRVSQSSESKSEYKITFSLHYNSAW